jgi:hypothetical protein
MRAFGGTRTRLRCTRAGHALVIHPKAGADEALLAFAARRAAEPAHTAVVVDVPPDTPVEAFEDVIDELAACPGVLRLMPARPDFVSTAAFGLWLANRCHRTVLAHDGRAITVAGGGLFIRPGVGSGWMRFDSGRGPFVHSRRFPRPYWDCPALAEPQTLGSCAMLCPTPAGAWIIGTDGSGAAEVDERHWIVNSLLPDARMPRIVVGYPGSPITPLSAVAQFWHSMPESVHPAMRFSLLGALDDTSAPFGQLLADAVDAPVIVGVGVRSVGVDAKGGPTMHTVLPEGTMVWFPYVRELGYLPAAANGGTAPAPVPIEYRPPIPGLPEREPGVYEYDYDAVLEVTQSGLWMRPSAVPAGSHAIRGAAPEPDRVKVVYDASTQETGRRMLVLAREAVSRLEPGIRAIAALLAPPNAAERYLVATAPTGVAADLAAFADADELPATTNRSIRNILGTLSDVRTVMDGIPDGRRYTGEYQIPGADPHDTLSTAPGGTAEVPDMFAATVVMEQPPGFGRVQDDDIASPWDQERPESAAEEEPPDWQPAPAPEPEPELEPEPEPEPERIEYPSFQLVSSPEDFSFGEPPESAAAQLARPATQASAMPAAAPVVVRPTPAPAGVAPGPGPVPGPGPELRTQLPSVSITPVAPPRRPEPRVAAAPARPANPRPTQHGPRVQPVPSAQATAIPPAAGIAQERVWLRRNLNKQYDSAASSVSRILSEHPGLRAGAGVGSAEVLTDLVAVKLYLDSETRSLDDAVRAATVGPHVPLARCVAAGLRRLPSYRGPARLRVDLREEEWQWYEEGRLVTEWSFCPVLTTGATRLPGAVEVRIWSMTARRTGLVDPALQEQAVFLPGTNFKVLRAGDGSGDSANPGGGESREILLRELARTEVAEDGTVRAQQALDEIALTALVEAGRGWGAQDPDSELTGKQTGRFAAAPGLIARPAAATGGAPARTASAKAAPASAVPAVRIQTGSALEGGALENRARQSRVQEGRAV